MSLTQSLGYALLTWFIAVFLLETFHPVASSEEIGALLCFAIIPALGVFLICVGK